jgi:hypothetical protein
MYNGVLCRVVGFDRRGAYIMCVRASGRVFARGMILNASNSHRVEREREAHEEKSENGKKDARRRGEPRLAQHQ